MTLTNLFQLMKKEGKKLRKVVGNLFESENISNLMNEENLKKKCSSRKKMKVEDFCLSNHARKPICKSQKKKKITED